MTIDKQMKRIRLNRVSGGFLLQHRNCRNVKLARRGSSKTTALECSRYFRIFRVDRYGVGLHAVEIGFQRNVLLWVSMESSRSMKELNTESGSLSGQKKSLPKIDRPATRGVPIRKILSVF